MIYSCHDICNESHLQQNTRFYVGMWFGRCTSQGFRKLCLGVRKQVRVVLPNNTNLIKYKSTTYMDWNRSEPVRRNHKNLHRWRRANQHVMHGNYRNTRRESCLMALNCHREIAEIRPSILFLSIRVFLDSRLRHVFPKIPRSNRYCLLQRNWRMISTSTKHSWN